MFLYKIRLVIFVLLLTIIFPSKCFAFVQHKICLISGGDISKISSEIHFHIHKKKHQLLIKDPQKGFYYYNPRAIGLVDENSYIITTVKQINDRIYLYIQNNSNAYGYKEQLLKHLKKNGLKYKKIKDKTLQENFEKYTDKLVNNYKYSNFYAGDFGKDVEIQKTSKNKNIESVKQYNTSTKPSHEIRVVENNYVEPSQYYNNSNREVSKAGVVFNNVKNGIVTITLGYGHGSGFLVDKRGLILTNYHVVKSVEEENLRIRFGQNQVVSGKVIATDPQNDTAIIWVNLQNIKNYRVLKLASPRPNNPLVVMGEKILAIGSPLEWESMERTLTQGVVSKCDKSVIMHDANIDPGNSGGPLLSYGGYVVGINTFHPNNSRGLSGSVPITRAYDVLKQAQTEIKTKQMPKADLMPDIVQVSYSLKVLENAYYRSVKKVKDRDEPYKIGAGDFDIYITTPAVQYRAMANKDNRSMKKFKKRQEEAGFEVSDEDYESKNLAYFNNLKPVVRVLVIPEPHLTLTSWGVNAICLAADILFNTGTSYLSYNNYAFDKDFKKLNLLNSNNSKTYIPFTGGKAPYTIDESKNYGFHYTKFSEKTYIGIYEFDPKYFQTEDELTFNIYYSNTKPPITKKIKDKIKNYIIEDFKPYWSYIDASKPKEI